MGWVPLPIRDGRDTDTPSGPRVQNLNPTIKTTPRTTPAKELLSDLYLILREVVNPTNLGWAIRRPRQICVLLLKCFLYPVLTGPPLESLALTELAFGNTYRQIFFRDCNFHCREFMIATTAEVSSTLASLASRRSVCSRWDPANVVIAFQDDAPGMSCLSVAERERLVVYERTFVV